LQKPHTPAPPWRTRAANLLWFGRSLRTQIVIVFIAISLVAASVAGGIIIFKAGVSTRIEMSASMRLADLMVNEAVQLIQQGVPAEPFLRRLPDQMRYVRHVRVEVRDAAGQPLVDPPMQRHSASKARVNALSESALDDNRAAAPAWFAMLIGPPVERHEMAVTADGHSLGTVEIISEPRDEIAEVWGNTVALAAVAVMTVLAIVAILYLALGRVLDPLTALGTGLHGLERRNYKVRLQRPKVLEFAAIVDRFNALAGALDALRTENLALNRRLITAQDDERRRTALELHDEVGPSLFGLKANVASIATAAAGLPDAAAATVAERVQDLTAVIDHLQGINRGMLNRLRPMALGNLPLADIIAGLVRDRAREHPHIVFTHDIATLDRSYDDTVDLTVYRCVQESLTNAIRHANAKRIEVRVAVRTGDDLMGAKSGFAGAANSSPPPCGEGRGAEVARGGTAVPYCTTPHPIPPPQGGREHLVAAPHVNLASVADGLSQQFGGGESLELTVRDDGYGIPAGQPPGFGLRGMQERVQALGGEFTIEARSDQTGNGPGNGGACVRITIPLPPRPSTSAVADVRIF
jgi:two-component system sensor histidine kinase UhpB